MNHFKLLALSIATLCCLSACADTNQDDNTGVLDDENAVFGASGKADNVFSECELLHVLEFVNSSSTTVELLRDIGLNSRAANNVVNNRLGKDGKEGTGDDNIVLDLKTLDEIKYIGPKSLEVFASHVSDRCTIDLSKREYIDSSYLNNPPASAWSGRSAPEIEATRTLTGITGRKLNDILNGEDDRGRTGFERIRRAKIMGAFSFGFPIDEIPCGMETRTSCARACPTQRTPSSLVASRSTTMTVSAKCPLGRTTCSIATTTHPTTPCSTRACSSRGRIRFDTDTVVRRLLVAAKFDSDIDANGLKSALKIDQRTEGGQYMDVLDNDIRGGKSRWSNGSFNSIHEIYKRLDERKVPQTSGAKRACCCLTLKRTSARLEAATTSTRRHRAR